MKRFLLIILCSAFAAAQVKAPGTDFTLEHGKVYWQHTYSSEILTSEEMSAALTEMLKTISAVPDPVATAGVIRFSVGNDRPDHKTLGEKLSKSHLVTLLYMKYVGTIEIKEKSYTVTLREIFMDNKDRTDRKSGDISKFVCNTSNLTFKDGEALQRGLQVVNRHLLQKYDVSINTPGKSSAP